MSAEGCGTQKSDNLLSTPRTNMRPEPPAGSPRSPCLLGGARPGTAFLVGRRGCWPPGGSGQGESCPGRVCPRPSVASSLSAAEKSCLPALCYDLDPAGLGTATQHRPGEREGLGDGHLDSQSTSLPGTECTSEHHAGLAAGTERACAGPVSGQASRGAGRQTLHSSQSPAASAGQSVWMSAESLRIRSGQTHLGGKWKLHLNCNQSLIYRMHRPILVTNSLPFSHKKSGELGLY